VAFFLQKPFKKTSCLVILKKAVLMKDHIRLSDGFKRHCPKPNTDENNPGEICNYFHALARAGRAVLKEY